jgi:hypothetical protein
MENINNMSMCAIMNSMNIGDNIIVNDVECIILSDRGQRLSSFGYRHMNILTLHDIHKNKTFDLIFDDTNYYMINFKYSTNEYVLKLFLFSKYLSEKESKKI